MSMKWYLLQTHTNCEKAVQRNLMEIIERKGYQDIFGRIIVPAEEVVSMKNGQKVVEERKLYPNYILIEMNFSDQAWHIVKQIPKVTKFIGGESKPTPLKERELKKIFDRIENGQNKPVPKVQFEPGETVRIKEGPFSSFEGAIDSVNYERSKLRVSVVIFGRSTPVELEFNQVEKI